VQILNKGLLNVSLLPFFLHLYSQHVLAVGLSSSAQNTFCASNPCIGDKKQTLYNLFAAYLHTIPLEESIAIDEASFEGMLASLEDSWND
jgi:hypothetical protein